MRDVARLGAGWSLWRDFAVRSAGFPVVGLEAFGPGNESGRLREVAGGGRFQEAVNWQNPAALANAVLNVASGAATKPSRARQREEVVASYWQRYCAKNDTIGFFGPLTWGRIEDDGAPFSSRSGELVKERSVHLEAWGVQALAETLDPELTVAGGSVDVQLAAPDEASVAARDYLADVGHVHPGTNPLIQGVFAAPSSGPGCVPARDRRSSRTAESDPAAGVGTGNRS